MDELKVFCVNFRYGYMLNDTFAKIIPSEFAMIMVVMCYSLIHMAFNSSNTGSCIQDVMIVASTLAPIFYYCWFGNEIKLKVIRVTDFNFTVINQFIWKKIAKLIIIDRYKKKKRLHTCTYTHMYIYVYIIRGWFICILL